MKTGDPEIDELFGLTDEEQETLDEEVEKIHNIVEDYKKKIPH